MIIDPYRFAPATDPLFANVVLLLHGNGANNGTSFPDSSSYAHSPTVNGNLKTSTAQSKFNGSSIFGDNSGDFLNYGVLSEFSFGNSDFTIEAFISQYGTIWKNNSTPATDGLVFYVDPGGGNVSLIAACRFANSSAATLVYTVTSEAWGALSWHHVAFCKSGSNLYLLHEGSLVDTDVTGGSAMATLAGGVWVGRDIDRGGDGYDRDLDGYLAEVRVTIGASSARYTGAYMVPTAPHPNA